MLLLFIIFLTHNWVCYTHAYTMHGYDCLHPNTSYIALNSKHVNDCVESYDKISTNLLNISLFALSDSVSLPSLACYVHVLARVDGCGIGSHSYPKDQGILNYNIHLTTPQCQLLHRENTFVFGPHVFKNLLPRHTNTRMFNYANVFEGTCSDNVVFTLNNKKYRDAYAQVSLTIKYIANFVTYNPSMQTIITDDSSTCLATENFCIDRSLMIHHFEIPIIDECESHRNLLLYSGLANVTQSNHDQSSNITIGSVITVYTIDHMFILEIVDYQENCLSLITSVPNLIIRLGLSHLIQARHKTRETQNQLEILALKISSQMETARSLMNSNFNNLYKLIKLNECEALKHHLKSMLPLAYIEPNLFAYEYTGTPGFTAITLFEAIYLIKCAPVTVFLRESDKCHKDIPIIHDNIHKFLTPRNHLIVNSSVTIPCHTDMHGVVEVSPGEWISLYKLAHQRPNPDTLNPNTRLHKSIHNYKPIYAPARGSVVTESDVQMFQNYILLNLQKSSFNEKTNLYLHAEEYMGGVDDVPKIYKTRYTIISMLENYFINHNYVNWIFYMVIILGLVYLKKIIQLILTLKKKLSKTSKSHDSNEHISVELTTLSPNLSQSTSPVVYVQNRENTRSYRTTKRSH